MVVQGQREIINSSLNPFLESRYTLFRKSIQDFFTAVNRFLFTETANARICMLTEVGRSGKLLPTTGHRRSRARIMTLGVSGLDKLPVPSPVQRNKIGQYPKPLPFQKLSLHLQV
jgi:hypothetical protein